MVLCFSCCHSSLQQLSNRGGHNMLQIAGEGEISAFVFCMLAHWGGELIHHKGQLLTFLRPVYEVHVYMYNASTCVPASFWLWGCLCHAALRGNPLPILFYRRYQALLCNSIHYCHGVLLKCAVLGMIRLCSLLLCAVQGIHNSQLVSSYAAIDSRFSTLAILIKTLAKVRNVASFFLKVGIFLFVVVVLFLVVPFLKICSAASWHVLWRL